MNTQICMMSNTIGKDKLRKCIVSKELRKLVAFGVCFSTHEVSEVPKRLVTLW